MECPYCGMDNAYCDGVEYVCPDCDNTWSCDELPDNAWDGDDDEDDDDEIDYPVYINGRRQ